MFQLRKQQCRSSISLTPPEDCFCLPCLLCPHGQGPTDQRRVRKRAATHDVTLPTTEPPRTSSNPGSTSPSLKDLRLIFKGMLHLVRPRRKLSHYQLRNMWKENYLPKAALNQCCPTIYLAHTRRSCVNVCQRM